MKLNNELHVGQIWYKKMCGIVLRYVGICVPVLLIVMFSLNLAGESNDWIKYAMDPLATCIFMLVLGIVLPLVSLEPYVALGVTRRQLYKGIITAAVSLSLTLAIFHAFLYVVTAFFGYDLVPSENIPVRILLDAVMIASFFLSGWLIALGFIHARLRTIVLGILLSVVWTNVVTILIGTPLLVYRSVQISPLAALGVAAAFGGVMGVVLLKSMNKLCFNSK